MVIVKNLITSLISNDVNIRELFSKSTIEWRTTTIYNKRLKILKSTISLFALTYLHDVMYQ